MLNPRQIERSVMKLERFCEMLDETIFEKVFTLSTSAFETDKQYHDIPGGVSYKPMTKGDIWGGEGIYCWFKSDYTVPKQLEGVPLYVRPHVGGYEAMLWVDGKAAGTFATKIVVTGHGNHYCDLIAANPTVGQNIELAIEFYAGHYVIGEQPFQTRPYPDYKFEYKSIDICVKNELHARFMLDLTVLLSLYRALDKKSFRRAALENVFLALHEVLYYSPYDTSREVFDAALQKGLEIMAPALAAKNGGESVPYCGVIGHSHMDTAWLWHIAETIKKCARTYSNQLSLMDQYPEYKFVQSSSYHSEMMRADYPELFERIAARVREGRYEPNGGVWVECDCNITSGESMVRQFLWGQRFTRKYFDYTSDCFWLPDTFGYSAAIPQIMKSCGVDYFLTTKIAWNDTNPFPYDSFYWQGMDGTKVFTHFNKTHIGTAPHELMPLFYDEDNADAIRQKNVSKSKLVSFGYGDGGGGPQWDQIEITLRCRDLEGCPRYEYTTVSDFMKRLEEEVNNPETYCGELYLELHRGTLTNQHEIKRNNRLGEIALHNLEALCVSNAVAEGVVAADTDFRHLQNTVLVNQFHDILPGTCIERANTEAKVEMTQLLKDTDKLTDAYMRSDGDDKYISVYNPSPFERNDCWYLPVGAGKNVKGLKSQYVSRIAYGDALAVQGATIAPYASAVFEVENGEPQEGSAFSLNGDTLETPFATVTFNESGAISSFYDKQAKRELCGEGFALNTFLLAEDVPAQHESWDIDADIELKLRPEAVLLTREVVSDGALEFRIRSTYQLSEKSSLAQDMVFFAHSPEVRFETIMEWHDDQRILKTAFDTSVFTDFARQEVQFGYLKRPTTRNTSVEKAKFEVLNHKYTDISEHNYGIALLNDCKYGISLNGGQMRLTLHTGGNRPDHSGDKGTHYCEYSFLPHNCGFDAGSVVKPAYELNYKPVVVSGCAAIDSLARTADDSVIIETIKPCEDAERAFILRLYESVGSFTHTELTLGVKPKEAHITNMLEEIQEELEAESTIALTFKPFEIKTIKIAY